MQINNLRRQAMLKQSLHLVFPVAKLYLFSILLMDCLKLFFPMRTPWKNSKTGSKGICLVGMGRSLKSVVLAVRGAVEEKKHGRGAGSECEAFTCRCLQLLELWATFRCRQCRVLAGMDTCLIGNCLDGYLLGWAPALDCRILELVLAWMSMC